MNNKIKILVIDDHPLFRQGVVDILNLEEDIQVVGQASNGEDGLLLIRALLPDIAIVDVNMPGMNGQALTRTVVAEKLPTKIILLTAYDDEEQKAHAMRMGAAAYCTKDIDPDTLMGIVRNVIDGLLMFNDRTEVPAGIEIWLGSMVDDAVLPALETREAGQPLSSREMEVLKYVARGMSNKEIALVLGISHQTVKNHVTAILRKIGVEDRTQAAIFALRRGWVRLHRDNKQNME
jgi:DNA-binding NarL/FixJ family response regulator